MLNAIHIHDSCYGEPRGEQACMIQSGVHIRTALRLWGLELAHDENTVERVRLLESRVAQGEVCHLGGVRVRGGVDDPQLNK